MQRTAAQSGTGKGQSWCEKSIDQYVFCSRCDLHKELELMNLLQKDNRQCLHILSAPRACMKHNKVVCTGLGFNHNTHG